VIVNNPATVHASNNQPGAPINRDDSAETMKMPDPIIEPITIMVASSQPRLRTSEEDWSRSLFIDRHDYTVISVPITLSSRTKVEGSRKVTLKVSQRDPSTPLG
jgi:hypothetical protein